MAQLPVIPVRDQGEGISTPNISGGIPVTVNEKQIYMCVCTCMCTCKNHLWKNGMPFLRVREKT